MHQIIKMLLLLLLLLLILLFYSRILFINWFLLLRWFLGSVFTFDQVFVQGMPGTHRSVFQYYVKTSITRRGFVQIEGEGGQKVL